MTFPRLLTAFALSVLGLAAPAAAQTPEEFYAGKDVRMLIGYSPGGGYDTYARLIARHIGKHIPGNPEVIVENMPGAGSLTLTNYLANIAPADGTVFGAVSRGVPVEPILGQEPVQYDARELTWIGSATDEVSVCAAWADSGITSWSAFMESGEPFVVGGTGATSDVEVFTRMLIQLFGAKLDMVSGYPGGGELALAMEQGEIDGRCGWSWSSIVSTQGSWLENGQINVVLQLTAESVEGLEDVPLVYDFAETDEQRQVLDLVLSRLEIARPYVAPPGMPEDRADALQLAFMDTMSDPEFLAEAKSLELEINPTSGDDMAALIAKIYATPDAVIENTRQILAVQE